MNLIENAKRIASRAHSGQHRRDGYTPYINHPAAVAERLASESPEVVATAWLHDVLEDTDENPESLREAGIPWEVIEAVQMLTKTDEDYVWYLSRVKAHPIARKVKVADMLANLADSPTEKQIVKYARGLLFLANAETTKPTEQQAIAAVRSSDLLAAIRDAAQGRGQYLREKAERFNSGPEDYKQLMAREKTMIDLVEVMAGAIRRLAANI